MRHEAAQHADTPRDLAEVANELFFLHAAQYVSWQTPPEGAVSPALSAFFRVCHPHAPALVHWARWLRLDHGTDGGLETLSPAYAEALVEAILAQATTDPALAEAMRRAVRGEGIGERDPDQLELF